MEMTQGNSNIAKKAQRSRFGCRRCKRLKVKCDEDKPSCSLCLKSKNQCDYSIPLTWGGRPFKNSQKMNKGFSTIVSFNKKLQKQEDHGLVSFTTPNKIDHLKIVQESFPPKQRSIKSVELVKKTKTRSRKNNIVKDTEQFIQEINKDNFMLNFKPNINFSEENPLFLFDFKQELAVSKEILALDEQLKFIPTSINPFPDLLLENPSFREYYHSYVQIFSKLLSPANPSLYTENPFTCILPRMSISAGTNGVLCALIATSVLHTSVCQNKPFPEAEINDLLAHSLDDLYNRLIDEKEAQSDYTLALVLSLSFFENFRGRLSGWREHYYGAKKIILSRGFLKEGGELEQRKKVSFELGRESDLTFFFSRWFAYLDVIGALCSSSLIYASSASQSFLIWEGPHISKSDRENLKDIDLLMGFDFKILEFFCEIIALIDDKEKTCPLTGSLSIDIIERALDVKQNLISYIREKEFQRDEIEVEILANPSDKRNELLSDYRILRGTNAVFGLAGALQICRRVLMMSSQSKVVQDIVREMTYIFDEKIPENTTAAYCTVFSMFSAGCEATDEETKQFYSDRLSVLHQNGSLPAVKAHELMVESWRSGKYWADMLSATNSDIVFV